MPQCRGSANEFAEDEFKRDKIPAESPAENRTGHRPLASFQLPSWVQHPDFKTKRHFLIEKQAYVGMAVSGSRNYEGWNVAHVAAFHDDLKLLSLATREQCMERTRWGLTPAHMCCMGVHPDGAALCVLYVLLQMDGVVDPTAQDFQGCTPWHIAQRQYSPELLKAFEKVMYQGHKPANFNAKQEAQLRARGKFAKKLEDVEKAVVQVAPAEPPLPVCLVFPGQGSQYVGMLQGLKDLEPVRRMLESAESILGFDVLKLCLDGPEDILMQTKYCQPAMFIASMAALEQLKIDEPEKVSRCQAVAGLSLGEFTALAVAGVFDFETGLRLVKARADAMDSETSRSDAPKQAMLSVAGIDCEVLERLCRECAGAGQVCQIANFLWSTGFTVAGDREAVEKLEPKAIEAKAVQAKLLKTGGAFHTPMMKGAQDKLLQAFAEHRTKFKPPRCQVYMNVTGKPIGPATPVDDIITMLGQQLVSPVLWRASMQQAINDGCQDFFECGPSKQLKSIMKRINLATHNAMLNIPA